MTPASLIPSLQRAICRFCVLPVESTDRFGRTGAEVISDININLVMVEDGQVFAYRRYLSGCDAKAVLDAQFRARRHRDGVWQVEDGITRPWELRRGRCAAERIASVAPGYSQQLRAAGSSRATGRGSLVRRPAVNPEGVGQGGGCGTDTATRERRLLRHGARP